MTRLDSTRQDKSPNGQKEDAVTETKRFPIVPGCSPLYSKLYELLTTTTSDTLTDEQIEEHIGRTVARDKPHTAYATLLACIKRAEGAGIVWRRIPKADAIKRCNEVEKGRETDRMLRSTRRITRRATNVIRSVDINQVPVDERAKFHARAAQVATLMMFADTGTTKKLEARAQDAAPDIKSVMQLMSA